MYFIHLCGLNQQLCYDLNILLLLTTIFLIADSCYELCRMLLKGVRKLSTNTVVLRSLIPPTPTLNVFLCVEQGNDPLEHSNGTTSFEDCARSCNIYGGQKCNVY